MATTEFADVVFSTIATQCYLPQVLALGKSLGKTHPGAVLNALIVDWDGSISIPAGLNIKIIPLDALQIPDLKHIAFKYDVVEFCTAVKPWFLRYLFGATSCEKLFYLDPDLYFTSSLRQMIQWLDDASFVLTPHVTSCSDGISSEEALFLRSGVYNFGFFGMRRSKDADLFLDWWWQRLKEHCYMKSGYFVDQFWAALLPCYFSSVRIVRDPGYNVATWNLCERKITRESGKWKSNGEDLVFFHFSRPDVMAGKLSKSTHSMIARHTTPALQELAQDYYQTLIAFDYERLSKLPYSFGSFSNGKPVRKFHRRAFAEIGPGSDPQLDPFDSRTNASFRKAAFVWALREFANRVRSTLQLARIR